MIDGLSRGTTVAACMTDGAHTPERSSGEDCLTLLNRTPVHRIKMTPRSGYEL